MTRLIRCCLVLLTGLTVIDLAAVVSIPDLKGRHGNRPCRAQLIHCLLAGRTAVGERVWDTQRLLPRAARPGGTGDMADVGALSAPRALLAVHGRKDGLHCSADVEAAMARVHRIYSAAGASNHFRHKWGAAGHKFYPDIMWPFIESALAK